MINFKAHNERSERIWKAYEEGNPIRVPVTIYADVRNWIHEPGENPLNITMADYIRDADRMLDCQIKASEWIRHHILSDSEMGYPKDGWSVMVDFQNFLEPAWFGAPVVYGKEPHCEAFLTDDSKWSLLDQGIPEPFAGINAEVVRRYEYFTERTKDYTYKGIPLTGVQMPYNMMGSDGPFTIACSIRGTEGFLIDLLEDSEYARQLLSFITRALIRRIKEVRKVLGMEERAASFGFADDSIVLLSTDMYREFVLPYHKQLFEELTLRDGQRSMHLCGDAQRFFPILERELQVKSFDTGFPIAFERLYDELSPDVRIFGGPSIKLIRYGTPEGVREEAKRILRSGVMEKSRKFILREGNALAPGTPMENVNAIYEAAEEFGGY